MRTMLRRLGQVIDTPAELFELLQVALYLILITVGILYLFVLNGAPIAVRHTLDWSGGSQQLWYWMHIGGGGLCLAGKLFQHSKNDALDYSALGLILAGDIVVFGTVLMFCIGAFMLWGGAEAAFYALFILIGAVTLIARDCRALAKIEGRL